MAKKNSNSGNTNNSTKVKKTINRQNSFSTQAFLAKFSPMAKEGKSALEIGQALGVVGTDEQIRAYVSVKASNIRNKIKQAREKGLIPKNTPDVPELRGGGNNKTKLDEVAKELTQLLGELDSETQAETQAENEVEVNK